MSEICSRAIHSQSQIKLLQPPEKWPEMWKAVYVDSRINDDERFPVRKLLINNSHPLANTVTRSQKA